MSRLTGKLQRDPPMRKFTVSNPIVQILIFAGIVGALIILQTVILPRLGVPT